jgi:glutamyl-tRNA reductase
MTLVLVGTSHRLAPVEVRERLALGEGEAGEAARVLADGGEAICLSTCNRTELYLAAADPVAAEQRAEAMLKELSRLPEQELVPVLYRLRDHAAALHLFRVAAGLDSLIPGEGEILGQVRTAAEVGTPGPFLDRLFRDAVHAGRKVRSQTAISENPASVSSAAAALAQQVFGELDGRKVLVIGAGKISEQAARNLVSRGAVISAVANRSVERAEELAGRFGARAVPLDSAVGELGEADVVVSSTSAGGFVLERDAVHGTLGVRRGRPLFLIDLAVPRDLDPAIHDLPGCYLYDIDDLQAVVTESLAGRRSEAARAEEIVAAESERFRAWQASLDVVPAIASLRARAEEIRARELARVDTRLAGLSEHDRKAVESLTSQIVNKLLHLPTIRMKEAAAAGADGGAYADVVRDLFGLEDPDADSGNPGP